MELLQEIKTLDKLVNEFRVKLSEKRREYLISKGWSISDESDSWYYREDFADGMKCDAKHAVKKTIEYGFEAES